MVELVWDANHTATATSSEGATIRVGPADGFAPDDLLALAAASCLMRTFLRLTDEAHVTILSFAATARVEHASDATVRVRTFILGPDDEDDRRVSDLVDRARLASPVCRLLGARVGVDVDVRLVHPTP